ncbi:MAG: alpha-2-macroglobulin [Flavihumibacter sp.]
MRVLLAFVAIWCFACNSSKVTLEFTNAEKEVQPLQNLVFRFNHPLVKDSLLNRWDSTRYIRFEPAIPGRFRWESPEQLVFSPSQPLKPATTYKMAFTKELLINSEYSGFEKGSDRSFSTPLLKLENSQAVWMLADEASRKALPRIDLQFNYPVDPAVLKDKLSVTSEGSPVSFQLVSASATDNIELRLPTLQPADKDVPLSVTLAKGLVPADGTNPAVEDAKAAIILPSPFVLVITDLETDHDGANGKVYVKTSQPVEAASLAGNIKFDPAVKFKAEVSDEGFTISSDAFSQEKSYALSLGKGLRGRIGGQLRETYTNNVAFGQLEPSVSFAGTRGAYLSALGAKNIALKITNIDRLEVVISKIYESNLLAAHRYGYYPNTRNHEEDEYYYDEYQGGDASLGDIIYQQEIDTRSLPLNNGSRLFNFNFTDKLPDNKGSYHIQVRSKKDYWVSDSRFVSMSDIGLIAKEAKDRIVVFANSIQSAQPLAGINVIAYGANNQVLGMGTSDAEGVANIGYARKEFAGFKPAMIIAKSAGDFNYILFNNTSVNTSRFDVGGKRLNSTGLDAFLYAERDIYRPGEQVHFALVTRDYQWKSPGEIPVKFKFLLPTGKEFKSFRKNLDASGATEGSIDIPVAALTGSYTLEAYSGNDVLISSMPFMIEEFVPDRIKVSAVLDKDQLAASQTANLAIAATNFFGPPAANRKFETEIQVRQTQFWSNKYPQYSFALTNQTSFFDKKLVEGNTDENGKAQASYTVPDLYKNIGQLLASFYTTVFDETGRPVSRSAKATIFTQDKFFGIGDNGHGYFPLNQKVDFPLIALDKTGKVLPGTIADVKVIKEEYHTVLNKSGSYFRYESQREEKEVAGGQVTIGGEKTVYSFVPRSPGNYQLRVSIPGSISYVSRSFYSYGYWGGDNNSFEVNTEGEIDIATDKEKYTAGEKVKILFKTPFSGRMLVTLEQDKVLSHQYLTVEKRSATLELPLTADHLPNVYVTATLFKPHSVSEIPLTVAHGFKSITVQDSVRKIRPEIIAAKESRSKTKQTIRVKAPAGSRVTLAAVDNGVLQVSGFETPDPFGFFYAQRALGVNAFDLYPLLFPELSAKRSSTGGDGELKMDQRVNPMPNKRVKILSYWSGIATASGGEASFTVDIPAFSGEVRLMAVAWKDNQFGSAEKNMRIADPLVLSTALPRFLSPRDTISVPVTISNTTGSATSAKATINVTGPVDIIGGNSQQVTVPANSEAQALFQVAAKPAIGAAKISIAVNGGSENYTDETDITVRPPSTLQQLTGSGVLQANTSQTIHINTSDFIAGSNKYKLVLTRNPAMELGTQLRDLLQYPYGCTEQTVSAAFPQLYFSDLSDVMQSDRGARSSAAANVQEAIRKIKMRQLYTGAITMWDNADTENWWASAYAAQFLLEAKKAGFDVDPSLIETLLGYLNAKLSVKSTINYIYNRDQNRKIAPKEVAYSLYVLSLAGRPNIASMNYYKGRPDLLALDGRYLLAAAYAIAGDKAKFQELLPASFSGEISSTQTGGSFYSPIRDEAVALNALLEVEPSHPQVTAMARHLVDQLKASRYYSTQESAFSLLAIGKMARQSSKGAAKATVTANGKTVGKLDNNQVTLTSAQLGSAAVSISTSGNAPVYYWWESEGISASGDYKAEDNFLKIRRAFFTRNGKPVTGNHFKQNDLIIVQLTLEKAYGGSIENVVITDLLPAGFEIENPRTKEIPGMEWIKDGYTPVNIDVRDDRIHMFVDAYSSVQRYYYAVRAVSIGEYRMGPASADAMYNPEYHSYNGAGKVVITR